MSDLSARPAGPSSLARRLRLPLLIGGPLVVLLVAVGFYLGGGRYESTDDAYIDSDRVDVSANIAGRVIARPVQDNQRVKAGDVLFRLDPAPSNVAAAEADAAVANARQSRIGASAGLRQRSIDVDAARVTLLYQQKELARQRILTASGVSSQAQLDAQIQAVAVAKAQAAAAEQAKAQAEALLGGGPSGDPEDTPAIRQAQAALARTRLNQDYTVIRAPQDGVVTKVDQLQVGDYINAAQPVFSLVGSRVWVTANFKEDQLNLMRAGQPVSFKVDAYPKLALKGRVESLSPGTGSSFSVLPAENATGNWVKVVQRLPIRLSIQNPPRDLALSAGLSVTAKVDTGHKRSLFGSSGGDAVRR